MSIGKVRIYWDYELQKGADLVNQKWGVDDYNQTEWLLDILKKNEINCCFAVLGYAADKGDLPYHAPEQIKQIRKDGHKIASHSYTHKELTNLSDGEILYELEKSKDVLERLVGKINTFVPPRNKPFCFFGASVNGDKRPLPWVWLSKLTINKLCELLNKTRYEKCRIYNIHNKILKNYNSSNANTINGVECDYSNIGNGFGKAAKKCVLDAIKTGRTAVIYSHPHELTNNKTKDEFLDFIDFVNVNKKYIEFS